MHAAAPDRDERRRKRDDARPSLLAAIAMVVGLAASGVACFQPRFLAHAPVGDDALAPPAGLFSHDSGVVDADDARCPSRPVVRRLTFVVTTVPVGGRFAPRNVGAIWVERESGEFVRTLEIWGGMRAKWLTSWQVASSGNTVDAITGATLDGHVTHTAIWNLRDVHGCDVSDGQYVLRIELTDRSGTGVVHAIPFATTDAAFAFMPADTATFQGMSVILE